MGEVIQYPKRGRWCLWTTGDDDIDARLYTWHSRVEAALSWTQEALRDAEQLGYEDPALDGLNAALKAVLTPRPVAPLLPMALQLDLFEDYDPVAEGCACYNGHSRDLHRRFKREEPDED